MSYLWNPLLTMVVLFWWALYLLVLYILLKHSWYHHIISHLHITSYWSQVKLFSPHHSITGYSIVEFLVHITEHCMGCFVSHLHTLHRFIYSIITSHFITAALFITASLLIITCRYHILSSHHNITFSWFNWKGLTFMILRYRFNSFRDLLWTSYIINSWFTYFDALHALHHLLGSSFLEHLYCSLNYPLDLVLHRYLPCSFQFIIAWSIYLAVHLCIAIWHRIFTFALCLGPTHLHLFSLISLHCMDILPFHRSLNW